MFVNLPNSGKAEQRRYAHLASKKGSLLIRTQREKENGGHFLNEVGEGGRKRKRGRRRGRGGRGGREQSSPKM